MFGKKSLYDYSESAVGSCERVHSCTKAVTDSVWCLIFITGCHQPNTELPSLSLAEHCCCSPSLCASSSSSVFLDHQSSCLAAGPARGWVWSQGLAGWCHPEHSAVSPATAREGLGQEGSTASFGSTLDLVTNSWKAALFEIFVLNEDLMSSAWDPQSVSPLENVVLCWGAAAPPSLSFHVWLWPDCPCWPLWSTYHTVPLAAPSSEELCALLHLFCNLSFCAGFVFSFLSPPFILPFSSYQ